VRPKPLPVGTLEYYRDRLAENVPPMDVCRELAEKHPETFGGIKISSVHRRIRQEFSDLGVTAPDGNAHRRFKSSQKFVERRPELVIPYESHLLVTSDAHFPVHSEATCNMTLRVVRALGLKKMLLGGDQLHNDYKGHKDMREIYAEHFDVGVAAFVEYLEALMDAGIEEFIFIMGNHDDKPLRQTDGELSFTDWWKTQVWNKTSQRASLLCSERYYCIMEAKEPWAAKEDPMAWPYRLTHQKNYGVNPGSVARAIAIKYDMHTICFHQHHLSYSKTLNNKYYAIDAGCSADPLLAGYKEIRDTKHPQWTPGFLTITNGVPELWDMSNPPEWWDERLRSA